MAGAINRWTIAHFKHAHDLPTGWPRATARIDHAPQANEDRRSPAQARRKRDRERSCPCDHEDRQRLRHEKDDDTWSAMFSRAACETARLAGEPLTFLIAALAVVVWAATGPLFGFSDTWQLVINTSTTIITFLMVFLIQHTQNRDAKAHPLEAGRADHRDARRREQSWRSRRT